MPVDPVTAAVVGTSLLGGLFGNSKAKKASRANRRANELESERRGIQNTLARRRSLAERRRLQAAARSEAIAQGVGLSSQENASVASVDSQISANVAIQRQLEGLDQERTEQLTRAGSLQQQAQNVDSAVGAITGIFGQLG